MIRFLYSKIYIQKRLKQRQVTCFCNAPPMISVFVPGYLVMVLASMVGYLGRGRPEIVRALGAGAAAGLRGRHGRPPDWTFDAPARNGSVAASTTSNGLTA